MRWPKSWATGQEAPAPQPAIVTVDQIIADKDAKIEQLRQLRRGDRKIIDDLRAENDQWRADNQRLRDELHRAHTARPVNVQIRELRDQLGALRRDLDQAHRTAALLDNRLARAERRPYGAPYATGPGAEDATQVIPAYGVPADETRLLPGWRVAPPVGQQGGHRA